MPQVRRALPALEGAPGITTGTQVSLAAGASQLYSNVGFQWATLTNADLGTSGSVTYTAACGEAPSSNISYISSADAAVPSAAAAKASSGACPSGSPAAGYYPWVSTNSAQWCGNNTFPVSSTTGWPSSGSFTVTASGGTATVTYAGLQANPYIAFTGLTNTSSATGSVTPGSINVHQVVSPVALPLPAGWQAGDMALAVDYGSGRGDPSGFTGLWNTFSIYGPSDLSYKVLATGDSSITIPAGAGSAIAVFVYRGVAGIGTSSWAGGGANASCPALALTKTAGNSWVTCLNAHSASVSGVNYSAYGLTNRSGGLTGTHIGVADTAKGVATWAGATDGPASGDNYAVELEST